MSAVRGWVWHPQSAHLRSWASRLLRGWLDPCPGVLVLSSRGLEFDVDSHDAQLCDLWATSQAASTAAYGDGSSQPVFTFIPPVTQEMASLPEGSVTYYSVSLKGCTDVQYHIHALSSHLRAKPEGENGLLFLLPFPLWSIISTHLFQTLPPESCNLFFKHYLSGLDVLLFYCFENKNRQRCSSNFHKWLYFSAWVLLQIIIYRSSYWFEGNDDAWKTPSFSFTTICFSTESTKTIAWLSVTLLIFSYFTHMG